MSNYQYCYCYYIIYVHDKYSSIDLLSKIFYIFLLFFYLLYHFFFFFFQAEDGIRDLTVTGVQTCALPISAKAMKLPKGFTVQAAAAEPDVKQPIAMALDDRGRVWIAEAYEYPRRAPEGRSEERRVGKECRSRWWP